jgi:hypothetical protein
VKVGDLIKFKSHVPRHTGKVFLLAWRDENGWAKLIGDIEYLHSTCASRLEDLEPIDNLGI